MGQPDQQVQRSVMVPSGDVENSSAGATRSFDWERLIGGRVLGIVSALFLMVGSGLFVKLAVDEGWVVLTDLGRCIGGAAFGMLLLAAGEVVRRTVGRLASVGLSGAGLGVLYLTTYAAGGLYDILPAWLTFALLLAIAVVGIGVSILGGLRSIGVLALVGGYVAPFMLTTTREAWWLLPVHLLCLLAVGLTLAWWRPSVFRALRPIAWTGTVVFGSVWLLWRGIGHPIAAIAFIAGVWSLVHAHLTIAVNSGRDGEATSSWRLAMPSVWSFATLMWAALFAGIVVLSSSLTMQPWHMTAIGLVGTLLLGLVQAGHLRFLRDVPRTASERLGASLFAQAGGLLIGTIALLWEGPTAAALSWFGIGLAFVTAGRWARSRPLDVYGFVVLMLGTARLFFYDVWQFVGPLAAGTAVDVGGLQLTLWTALVAFGAVAWFVASALLSRNNAHILSRFAGTLGIMLMYACVLHPQVNIGALAWAWLAMTVGVGAARWMLTRDVDRPWLDITSFVLIGVPLLAWLVAYPIHDWSSLEVREVLVHPGLLMALLMAVGLFAVPRLWSRIADDEASSVEDVFSLSLTARAAPIVGAVLIFVSTSAECFRLAGWFGVDPTTRAASLSVWWGLFGTALIVFGFVRRIPVVRHVGLGLILISTGKVIVFDLAGADPIWRVASFLGLGLLMSGVAVGYFKIFGHVSEQERPMVTGGDG